VKYDYIDSETQLEALCEDLKNDEIIGFDTEFVSEDTYHPELCLIQVAGDNRLAVIDPRRIKDLLPFWRLLAAPRRATIVHAGREEFRFCRRACQMRPASLFDVQLAAGFMGMDYPASYSKLISKILGQRLAKGETRTDWRRRPLTDRQLEYALQDVVHLRPLYEAIVQQVRQLDRLAWLTEELEAWQAQLERAETQERWQRVSGISQLHGRSLAIVRELWRWREQEAERRNVPPRRILRDDLLVELARRGKSHEMHVRAIRGIERNLSKQNLPRVVDVIRRAIDLPETEWPTFDAQTSAPQAAQLGQFIYTALASVCQAQQLAPALVATVQDVRDLVAYRLHANGQPVDEDNVPYLASGWRAGVIGRTIDDLLTGKTVIRIRDPHSDEPLAIEARHGMQAGGSSNLHKPEA
jgi:ribonuclease D